MPGSGPQMLLMQVLRLSDAVAIDELESFDCVLRGYDQVRLAQT